LERRISALALSQKPTLELTQEFVETYKQKTAYEKYPLNTVLALSVTPNNTGFCGAASNDAVRR
jgi:hypothetical protein